MAYATRKPTHPGNIILHDYMEPLKLTVSGLAQHLGVSRKHLSQVLHEKSSVTPAMALRLARSFNTSPDLWLNLQRKCDLWDAERNTQGLDEIGLLPELEKQGLEL